MTDCQSGSRQCRMSGDVFGDGFTIEAKRIRGWPCSFYTSYDPAFVTGHATDDDAVKVFIDFDAEFGMDWRQHPQVRKLYEQANKIAYQRLSDKIEETMQQRRKRWRNRKT